MTLELAILSINVAMLAVKYGKKIDVIEAGKNVLAADLDLPVADPDNIEQLENAILLRLLKDYADHGTEPLLRAEAKKLFDDDDRDTHQAVAFLALVAPKKLPDYALYKTAVGQKEDLQQVLILQSVSLLPDTSKQIFLLATEFFAAAASGFVPHVIGDDGVVELVKGVLTRFVENGSPGDTENLPQALATRAFNAGMDALATNSTALRGRADLLDFGFELVTTMKKGMGNERDWRDYTKGYFEKGGFVRFMGVLATVGGDRIVENNHEQGIKDLVVELTNELSAKLNGYQGDSKLFLKNNWHELVSGSLETLTSHSDALLPKEAEWIKLVVNASGAALTEIVKTRSTGGGDIARTLVARISASFVAKPAVLDAQINEAGLKKLIVSLLTPLSTTEGLLKAGLKEDLATRLVAGFIDIAAEDEVLRGKIFSETESKWIGGLATQFNELVDNEKIAGLFNEEGRKQLGVALVNATLKTLAAGKDDLVGSVSEEWLKGLIGSLTDAAGSQDFETLVGKGGVRNFLSAAVAAAEKNPSLLGIGGRDFKPVLPVLLGAVRKGLGEGHLGRADIGALLVESLGGWIGSRPEVQRLDLDEFITAVSKTFADAARAGQIADPSLLGEVIATTAKGLASRNDANHLVHPGTLAIALAWLFQRNLSTSDLLYATGRISAHLIESVPAAAIPRILDFNSDEWKALLEDRLAEAITDLPADTGVNLRTALFIGQIDKAIAAISDLISPPVILV